MGGFFKSLRGARKSTAPHFVRDYERFVRGLLRRKHLDEAMSVAVGGGYDQMGAVEADILRWVGLGDGMAVVDFGCGSGRLAHALGKRCNIDYVGIDVVQSLLDYAKTKSPPGYRFIKSHAIGLPLPDNSADMITSFSVFTHLMPWESYLYLQDMRRVLRPGGRIVMSFLEFANANHWPAFEAQFGGRGPINMHIERPVIDLWCLKLGLVRETFIDGDAHPWGDAALWQSAAILRNEK